MSGGEFCGNACRTAAMFMYKNYNIKISVIKINNLSINAICDGINSSISLNLKDLIENVQEIQKGTTIIKQKNMTQIVISENSELFTQNPTKKLALKIKDKFNLDDIAVGIIFLNKQNEIKPFIWVKAPNTFYEESACVSGSISAFLTLSNKKYFSTFITQPSNGKYYISRKNNILKISGKCSFEKEDSID